MLEYNDKMTLTGINAINKKGKIINYNLVFPLNDDDFYLPEDITEISVFEYHEGYDRVCAIPERHPGIRALG